MTSFFFLFNNFQWISMAWAKFQTPWSWHTILCKMKAQCQSPVFSSTRLENKPSIPSGPILLWSLNTNSSFLCPHLYPFSALQLEGSTSSPPSPSWWNSPSSSVKSSPTSAQCFFLPLLDSCLLYLFDTFIHRLELLHTLVLHRVPF